MTNGRSLFGTNVDARSDTAKRFRDLVEGYSKLLGGNTSLPKQSLIRRLAAHEVVLEQLEGDLANKTPVDMIRYSTISNAAKRLMQELGLSATTPTEKHDPAAEDDLASYLEGAA